MNIDLKVKTYEQLQHEVITLNTNSYLKDLKINKLQSNWNSLREYIKEIPEEEFINSEWYVNILDKMNELEGRDKNE